MTRNINVIVWLAIVAATLGSPKATGQYSSPSGQNCTEPTEADASNPGQTQGWAAGVTVNVYINPGGFTQEQLAAISTAFANWQGVGGVTFNVSTAPVPQSPAGATYVVAQETPSTALAPGANGNTTQYPSVDNADIEGADTELSSQITSCISCLADTMAHEIGPHVWSCRQQHRLQFYGRLLREL